MVFRAPQERCADAGRGVGKQAEGRELSGAPENWLCTRISLTQEGQQQERFEVLKRAVPFFIPFGRARIGNSDVDW